MRSHIEFIVYLVGLVPLGLAYSWLKSAFTSQTLFFVLGILYLVGLRIIGRVLMNRFGETPSD